MSEQLESVADFYRNGHILITGGTGFMGKLMIDKLLRSFSDIDSLYIMVRDKKGSSPEERVEKMFDSVIFNRLTKEVPNFRSKIKVIPSNIEAEHLGLSPESKQLLISKVNIIFHCAATLRFDEELQAGVRANLYATRQILNLAKQCANLKLLTYVSTAFCHANIKTTTEEKIYQPKTSYRTLIDLLDLSPDDPKLNEMRVKLAKENANTYTLTKAAAEQLLSEEGKDVPVSIFRPAIVISTWKDPVPGWIDNLYGPTGVVTGVQAGLIRTIHCNPDVTGDMVPADLTVNALVCSAWDASNRRQQNPTSLPIYNYVSSKDNPITWFEFQDKSFSAGVKTPPAQVLMHCYRPYMTKSRTKYLFLSIFLHYLIGYVFDFFFWLSRHQMRLVPIYKKLDKALAVLQPFSSRDWYFENGNVQTAWNRLSPADQSRFPFDIRDLDWDDYLETYVRGTMVYHLRDSFEPEVRKKALARYFRLTIIYHVLKGVLYALAAFFLWFLSRLGQ
ncbi:fatty acyl-CoA reductase wat-like [Diaphorina citri]|uniref:Fatty acyl-CoA reductase n=1 Tax=Diaphorina citri TaxID=121845 RepID=A0A3Q0J975_DIACI|nr:fatty acyl-CoA reductase wat-like [Diaphorina citri]